VTIYGEYDPEAEVRDSYAEAKRKVLAEGSPLGPLAVLALWVVRERTIRRLRKIDRAGTD